MGREGEGGDVRDNLLLPLALSPPPPRFQLSAGSFELHVLEVLLHPLLEDLGLHGGDGEAGAAGGVWGGNQGARKNHLGAGKCLIRQRLRLVLRRGR